MDDQAQTSYDFQEKWVMAVRVNVETFYWDYDILTKI